MKKTAIIPSNGKTKIGTVLISLFNGTPFIVTGGKKGVGSGPAHLASMLHGWNYTGEQIMVKNYHDITDDELNQMCGGHLGMFRKAQTDDVNIECIELNEMQIREAKSKQTHEFVKNDFKVPDDIQKGFDELNQMSDKLFGKNDDDKIGIWTIFNITKERFDELLKEAKPMIKVMTDKYTQEVYQSISKGGESVCGHLMPHPIAKHFSTYPANEYAMMAFILRQTFVIEIKQLIGSSR